MIQEPLEVLAKAATPLDALKIRWLVGGSVASSLHGIPRATLDIDLVAEIAESQIPILAETWSRNFLVDTAMIRDALERGGCCNLIHLESALKIDLFLGTNDPWVRQELDSPDRIRLTVGAMEMELPFARAEDVLLHKLRWFLEGGSLSDRQWGDILGIVRIRGEELDTAHLKRWAPHLRIPETLLQQALELKRFPAG